MQANFPDKVCDVVAVTVLGHRLGRAMGEVGHGKAGLTVVHTFLTVSEYLRDLRLRAATDPLYAVLKAYLAIAVSDAEKALKEPAPLIRAVLGPAATLLLVMQEGLVLLQNVWQKYNDDSGPHPSSPPPPVGKHLSRRKKGGR